MSCPERRLGASQLALGDCQYIRGHQRLKRKLRLANRRDDVLLEVHACGGDQLGRSRMIKHDAFPVRHGSGNPDHVASCSMQRVKNPASPRSASETPSSISAARRPRLTYSTLGSAPEGGGAPGYGR
ncbi:MAG: hypothetical protein U0Z44_10970 [Kouleothrix sp.]